MDPGSRTSDMPRSAGEPDAVAPDAFMVRVRLSISPWVDREFVCAVEGVCQRLILEDGAAPSWATAAASAEECLRAAGYPSARVLDCRTYSDVLEGVARWRVERDGMSLP